MYFAASEEVQFDDVELYMTVFQFGELRNTKQQISLTGREIRKRPFFCRLTSEKLIQVESPHNQTPLNYANPHAQVIVSSLPHLSPTPSVFSNENTAKDKGSLEKCRGWFLFWYFEKLVPFLSANEKWKKWNIFLYLLEKKII